MPQQRIHQVTTNKLIKLKESINTEREKEGEKLLTTPDLIEAIVDMFNTNRNILIKEMSK